jgi:hypothetical protein
MPPRWVSVVIVIGWIAAAAWLFRIEMWWRLQPGSPPPYTIDLIDEAQTDKPPIRWIVKQGDEEVLTARTTVEHRVRENDFTLRAVYEPRGTRQGQLKGVPLRIQHMDSSYRVTPEGRLLGLDVDIDSEVVLGKVPFQPHIWGEVRDGTFTPILDLNRAGKKPISLPAVAVSSQGSVVMPLHPVNRINGLRPGQSWRVPLFDPIGDSLGALMGNDNSTRFLRAKVRPEAETHEWNHHPTRCLVIDYEEESVHQEDRITAKTWVSEADGRVLRQEWNLTGSTWIMEREQ